MAELRAKLARALIRWSARWWDASYAAWVRMDKGEVSKGYHDWWYRQAARINNLAVPLAHRLDQDATGAEMVEHGWWG
jgi:hypothetical protein